MSAYPTVRTSGTPRERGRQYGEQARDRVHASVRGYDAVFRAYAGWDWQRVRQEGRRYAGVVGDFHPGALEEMRGLAEGAGLELDDVLALNVRTEIMFAAKAAKAVQGGRAVPAECTAIGVLPSRAGGRTLVSQNWDWVPHAFDTVVVLEAQRDDGPDFVTVVEAGLLAKTGLNAAGIAVATNALVCDDDVGAPAVPYHVALRALLDAETISGALDTLQRAPRSSSANYLLGHEDGLLVDVEATPGDFSRLFLLFPGDDGVLAHTNHFVAPGFDRKDVSRWLMPDSPFRLDRVRRLLATELEVRPETLQAVLADHAGHPFGVCCHPDERAPLVDQGATIVSVVMDLADRAVWVADGTPCSAPYRRLDTGALLGAAAAER